MFTYGPPDSKRTVRGKREGAKQNVIGEVATSVLVGHEFEPTLWRLREI